MSVFQDGWLIAKPPGHTFLNASPREYISAASDGRVSSAPPGNPSSSSHEGTRKGSRRKKAKIQKQNRENGCVLPSLIGFAFFPQQTTIVLVMLAAAAAQGNPQGYNIQGPGGSGSQSASVPANYAFQWEVEDAASNNFFGQEEQREDVNTQGR